MKKIIKLFSPLILQDNIKSLKLKVYNITKETDKLTNVYIEATNQMIRKNIEKKMDEYEILLNDLNLQIAQLELERGYRISEKDLSIFISEILKGDINDKDFQKKIIDYLVYKVYVDDDDIQVLLSINGGKIIGTISFEDVCSIKNDNSCVHKQPSLSYQMKKASGDELSFTATCFFVELIHAHTREELKVQRLRLKKRKP